MEKNTHTQQTNEALQTHINKYQHQHSLTATTIISTAKNINSLTFSLHHKTRM